MARLNINDIVTKVIRKVRDGQHTTLVTKKNQCNVDIATEISVKELAVVSEVTFTANENLVALPSDFLNKRGSLSKAYNHTINEHIKVYDSRRLLDHRTSIMGQGGNVLAIASDFPNVYYQYSPPSNQVVDLYYFAVPDDVISGSEFPNYIPNNYIYKLFFHYVCGYLFDYIEDGVRGEKVNTLFHNDKYDIELKKFKNFIGPDPDDPFIPRSYNPGFDFRYD